MAAKKFATMLHRNTNKITLVLIYAILEWILIILLLLNSLFSYLIIKFADYFGLKRPCLWCSRLDHIVEKGKDKISYVDLVCEAHAIEISKLGYCLNHRKLIESQDMCEDCSSSIQTDHAKLSKSFGFFPWINQIGMIQEAGDKAIKQNLITEPGADAEIDEPDHSDRSRSDFAIDHLEDEQSTEENRGILMVSDVDGGSGIRGEDADDSCACSVCDGGKEIVADEDYKLDRTIEKDQEHNKEESLNAPMDDQAASEQTKTQVDCTKVSTQKFLPQHLEFYIDRDDCHLVPVELIGSTTTENQNQNRYKVEDQRNDDVIFDFDMIFEAEEQPVTENWHTSRDRVATFSTHERREVLREAFVETMDLRENVNSLVLQAEDEKLEEQEHQQIDTTKATQILTIEDNVNENAKRNEGVDSEVYIESEESGQLQQDEYEADVSIGTEIPEQEQMHQYETRDILVHSNQHIHEDPSTSSIKIHKEEDKGSNKAEDEFLEFKAMSVTTSMQIVENQFSSCLELHEIEEEKVPDTPTSVESVHQLHKKLLLLERKESGTEESLDGSFISDLEGGEVTIEKLKSALRSERKALNDLYTELDEERNANAVAANQTMAMINRLQEEKAAMQMEALQYQRMMEEQSEYDQEALQLLNELMVKREKEKLELEKELEIYRKKVHEYEIKDKMIMSKREDSTRSRTSSVSCSNSEDSDGASIDLNYEAKEESKFESHQGSSDQNTPVDAVLYVEESLANFEEERLLILEQLKVLEDKLFVLNDDEEQHYDDMESMEHCEENGNGYHDNVDYSHEVNGFSNGHSKEINGHHHHHERKIMDAKAKRLLPLFDAIDTETEDGLLNGNENGLHFASLQNSPVGKIELEKSKIAIEEEVDHVYERLQALEEDRDFLKNCISSLRKGDKGLHLLKEILQHLRDLRSVELRVKNMGDGVL
ncbi:myosin-binding protein 2 [Quillaja saponaria]|uniref:Myosin-binding protein 2 n=1 Tax=Quillaja saponaria TaxID=32244 RepID=A0AAD7LAJ8_QUISA|nr:myosin-binding protein 2 [Quillaja saponaria]KAJ7954263.1 myosin-binding protein 2 [Quillaja saponaria]